ncbi:flagellar basal body rod protein FlgB [Diaminobutyricibacter sp. McL0608]|uniref:flagellar basal body rod protein FlgB n=1 Tax=Leifsonia sp. McL0608 TaxID=3143537 RepID=UPI0031F2EDF6
MIESVTQAALSSALAGLSARQTAIANNIANVNTPNYQAQRVSFEDALAASVANHDGHVDPVTQLSLEPTQLNGNNVNLDTETTSDIETGLRYRFATQAMTQQFAGIQAAMRTS